MGQSFNCTIHGSGSRLKCWGWNQYGQLGDSVPPFNQVKPVDLLGLADGVKSLSLGYYHGCLVNKTGIVQCWGLGEYGQLGEGSPAWYADPVTAANINTATQLSNPGNIGSSSPRISGTLEKVVGGPVNGCVLISGGVYCYGHGNRLGIGNYPNQGAPLLLAAGLTTGIKVLSFGENYACAANDSFVKCWGINNRKVFEYSGKCTWEQ